MLFYFITKTPFGQRRVHLPHFVHLLTSTTGGKCSICVSAPAGQAFTAEHEWFRGHFSGNNTRVFSGFFIYGSPKDMSYFIL